MVMIPRRLVDKSPEIIEGPPVDIDTSKLTPSNSDSWTTIYLVSIHSGYKYLGRYLLGMQMVQTLNDGDHSEWEVPTVAFEQTGSLTVRRGFDVFSRPLHAT